MVRVTEVEVVIVDVELDRPFYMASRAISRQNEIIVRVHTDEGITGTGFAHGTPLREVGSLIKHRFGPLLIGQDPLRIEKHWQAMFATTLMPRPPEEVLGTSYPKDAGRPQVMAAIAGIDIALWDIAGQVYGQPVWKLLGGARSTVPVYGTGGYYTRDRDNDGLAAEFEGYIEDGYRAFKLKAGLLSPEAEAERARIVRGAIGDDSDLYIDASLGWDLWDAIDAGHRYEELGVAWFEEPLHWYDAVTALADLGRQVAIPITCGESEYTTQGVRDLILLGKISITNFDCTKAGGLTQGLKIAAIADVHNVKFSPHHSAQVHAHLACGIPNGLNVEVHPDPHRDALWYQLYERRPEVVDGQITLDETPGLGVVIDESVLARIGVAID